MDDPTSEPRRADDAPAHPMADHVLSKIGLHAVAADDPCGPGMHLHLDDALLDPDGHVDFGVLGVFLDMACSQAGDIDGPFVHTDISVHRIDRPRGAKLFVDARMARKGKRTAVVHIDVHDDTGVRVAYSVQSLRQMQAPQALHDDRDRTEFRDEMRRRFMAAFDGVCRLPAPLHDSIELRRADTADGPVWRMPLGPSSRNGFGGLHGGVAFALVGDAAAGAAGGKTTSALLRYLAPGMAGPFRAEPLVMPQVDGDAVVRVEVFDEGADDTSIILGEVHVVTA